MTGTRGTNTRGSVSWTGTVPVPTVPGTRHRVRGSQSDGVQLYCRLEHVSDNLRRLVWIRKMELGSNAFIFTLVPLVHGDRGQVWR